MEWNKTIRYCKGFYKVERENRVIAANILFGNNVKLSKECFELIDDCIEKKVKVDEYFAEYSFEDREYIYKLIELLMARQIIADGNSVEEWEKKKTVSLKITNRCNLRCVHCSVDCRPDSDKEELSTSKWKQVIDKLDNKYIAGIVFTGGEAMFRNDFFELAEYAKEKVDVRMTLMTNGTLITENNADKLMELFDDFSFSIDGADEESCGKVRGKGVFDKIMRGINLLRQRGMVDYSVSFTELKINSDKKEKFIELAKNIGAEPMIRRFETYGRGADNKELLEIPDDSRFSPYKIFNEELLEMKSIPPHLMPSCINCDAIQNKYAICENGNIYPCLVLELDELCLGNVKDIESLNDFFENGKVYETEGYKYFKELHPCTSSQCNACPAKLHCTQCVRDVYLLRQRADKKEICDNYAKVIKKVWD